MDSKNDINGECLRVYEEIEFCREKFRLGVKALCEKAFYELHDEDELSREDEKEDVILEKYYQKYKKLFQRRPWADGRATAQTLTALESFRAGLYKTDEYRRIKTSSVIPPHEAVEISKLSKELDRRLKYAGDDEED